MEKKEKHLGIQTFYQGINKGKLMDLVYFHFVTFNK